MNTIIKDTSAQIAIRSSKASIFSIIAEHEQTPAWVSEVEKVRLLKDGSPKNGLGAIREVTFRPKLWTTVKEEIIAFTPHDGYQYKIIEGMPGLVDHLGQWSLENTADQKVLVTWKVHFEFKSFHWFRPFLSSFIKTFSDIQFSALDSLRNKVG